MTTASPSARYTFLFSDTSDNGMSRLTDQVNSFCAKYPEYRLFQVVIHHETVVAILTTDPV
jgi:hypothetical protein